MQNNQNGAEIVQEDENFWCLGKGLFLQDSAYLAHIFSAYSAYLAHILAHILGSRAAHISPPCIMYVACTKHCAFILFLYGCEKGWPRTFKWSASGCKSNFFLRKVWPDCLPRQARQAKSDPRGGGTNPLSKTHPPTRLQKPPTHYTPRDAPSGHGFDF